MNTVRCSAALYTALFEVYLAAREPGLHSRSRRAVLAEAVRRVRLALDDDTERAVARTERSRCLPR